MWDGLPHHNERPGTIGFADDTLCPNHNIQMLLNCMSHMLNPLHAKFFRGNINKNLHYTLRIFPPAIDIIPTLLAVVYSNGKYTN